MTRRPPLSRRALLSGVGALGLGAGVALAAGADGSDGSDWPMYRHDPAGTAHVPDANVPREEPTEQWTHEFPRSGFSTPSPILYDGWVFLARESLTTFDGETGDRLDRIEPSDDRSKFLSTPTVASARAYHEPALVASSEYGLQAVGTGGGPGLPILDGDELARRWTTGQQPANPAIASLNLGGHWQSSPVAADGMVFAADDGVTSVDASSGSILWSESHRQIASRPAVSEGGVYVVSYDGTVRELAADDGSTRWAEEEVGVRPEAQPVVANGQLHVVHKEGLTVLDAADGTHLWTRTPPVGEYGRYVTPPAATSDALYVAGAALLQGEQDGLVALDVETGDLLWDAPLSSVNTDTNGPAVAGGVVLQPDNYDLRAFDATTGEELWRLKRGATVSQPAIGDGRFYLADGKSITAYGGA